MVCSSRRVEIDAIPQEGAGMFSKAIREEWYIIFSRHMLPVLAVRALRRRN
jgi:hypothetical protein